MNVLTPTKAAEYLKISAYTLLEKARVGEIHGVKVGGRWRFTQESLDRHLLGLPAMKQAEEEPARSRRRASAPPSLSA